MKEEKTKDNTNKIIEKLKEEGKKLIDFIKLEIQNISLSYKKDKKLKELGEYIYKKSQLKVTDFTKDISLNEFLSQLNDIEKDIDKIKKEIHSIYKNKKR